MVRLINKIKFFVLPLLWVGYLIVDRLLDGVIQVSIESKSDTYGEMFGPYSFFHRVFITVIIAINLLLIFQNPIVRFSELLFKRFRLYWATLPKQKR